MIERKWGIFICKECHEEDKKAVGCSTPFEKHETIIVCDCDICGKMKKSAYCSEYILQQKEKKA